MAWSVNGVGTGIVKASRKQDIGGHTQFDAVQALIFFFMPIIPYRVIHVLTMQDAGYERQQFQSITLRPALRILAKAYLNGWGNVLMIGGGLGLPFIVFAFATMPRQLNRADWICLAVFAVGLFVGVISKLLWLVLDRRDQRIRRIMGPHELGTSDPYYWTDETANSVRETVLRDRNEPSLTAVAAKCLLEGDRGGAMFFVRLAMRCENDPEVDAQYAQILAG